MVSATTRYTYEDLLKTPEDGNRYEIIDGELIVSASPGRAHQEAQRRIGRVLDSASDNERLGRVYYAPVDVRLAPHDIVEPDLIFIKHERLGIYLPSGVVEGPPDIVVEILSPSSRTRDLIKKAKLYAWAGVPEYWWSDPDVPSLHLLTLVDGHYQEIQPENGILRSRALPHLTIDIAELFADIEFA